MDNEIKDIVRQAVIAGLYVALTVAISPLSYGAIQFRISEALVLLCFYRRDYSIGLIIGCFLANLFSPMAITDVPFGTLATAASVFLISRSKNLVIASLYPIFINGIVIGLQLNLVFQEPLLLSILYVAVGEAIVVGVIGVLIFKILQKNKAFMEIIAANQNF